MAEILDEKSKCVFTINATPEDALVTINGESVKSIEVNKGSDVVWSVYKEGYDSQSGTEMSISEDITKEITLVESTEYTYVKMGIGYIKYNFKLDENYNTGSTYDEYLDGCWILLSDEQLQFKKENPGASIKEVIKMELNPVIPPYEPTLEDVKRDKINEITQYDVSPNVNSFKLNGMDVWLDKDTRVGLMNSTQIEKAAGHETTTLWLGTISLTIECDIAIQLLSALELYALACYNKTAEHKATVENLETIQEVKDYDYTQGYPEKLNLSTTEGVNLSNL